MHNCGHTYCVINTLWKFFLFLFIVHPILAKIKVAMRTVSDILQTKEKPTNIIEPDCLVFDALQKLLSVNLSYLIVLDNDTFKGIFCERDYTRNVILKGRSSKETTVKDVMTTQLPEVTPANTVEDCMYKMNKRGTRYLAVYNENKFEGIITIHDLLRQILANKHEVFDNVLASSLIENDESLGKFF